MPRALALAPAFVGPNGNLARNDSAKNLSRSVRMGAGKMRAKSPGRIICGGRERSVNNVLLFDYV